MTYPYHLQVLPNLRALPLGKLHSPVAMTHQHLADASDLFCSLCVSSPARLKRHHATSSYTKIRFGAISISVAYELTIN